MRTDLELLLDTVEADAATPVINVSHERGAYPFAGCTMRDDNETGRGTRVYLDDRCTIDVTDAFNAWAAEHSVPRDPKMLELVRRVREQLVPTPTRRIR